MQQSKSKAGTALSRIAAATRAAMTPVTANGTGEAVATFLFNEDYPGFEGHFPGKPVLPGVCQIECVLALMGHWQGARAVLMEIASAKYVAPVLPGDEITCRISNLKGDDAAGPITLSAFLMKGNERVSDIKLKVRLTPTQGI